MSVQSKILMLAAAALLVFVVVGSLWWNAAVDAALAELPLAQARARTPVIVGSIARDRDRILGTLDAIRAEWMRPAGEAGSLPSTAPPADPSAAALMRTWLRHTRDRGTPAAIGLLDRATGALLASIGSVEPATFRAALGGTPMPGGTVDLPAGIERGGAPATRGRPNVRAVAVGRTPAGPAWIAYRSVRLPPAWLIALSNRSPGGPGEAPRFRAADADRLLLVGLDPVVSSALSGTRLLDALPPSPIWTEAGDGSWPRVVLGNLPDRTNAGRGTREIAVGVPQPGGSGESVAWFVGPFVVDGLDQTRASLAAGWLGIIGVGALLGLLFAWLIRALFVRRLVSVARATKAIRDPREFEWRVRDDADDEIGQLVRAFESLLERIHQQSDQLQATNEELEQAIHAKDRLLHHTSHELRTPLTTILNIRDALLDATAELTANPEAGNGGAKRGAGAKLNAGHVPIERLLRQLGDAADHQLSMVDELLDLARARAGRLPLKVGPVDLLAVLDEVLGLTSATADPAGASIAHPPLDGVELEPPAVMADRRRIVQVLVNLVANAIRHGRPADGSGVPHEIKVAVVWRQQQDKDEQTGDVPGAALLEAEPPAVPNDALRRATCSGHSLMVPAGEVWITVADNGPGPLTESPEALFEPFVRGRRPDTDVTETGNAADPKGRTGSGLGLAIARELATQMGGQLDWVPPPPAPAERPADLHRTAGPTTANLVDGASFRVRLRRASRVATNTGAHTARRTRA